MVDPGFEKKKKKKGGGGGALMLNFQISGFWAEFYILKSGNSEILIFTCVSIGTL